VSQVCNESSNKVADGERCRCNKEIHENFSNENMYSYQRAESSSFQSIPLTAPSSSENAPTNLLFGQCNRHISTKDGKIAYTLDIFANLYILEGNVFQTGEAPHHSYRVYLSNKYTKIPIGILKKDGDGLYKLKVTSNDVEKLLEVPDLTILYEKDGAQQILLQGSFN
jgi:hypothetical protein